MAPRPVNERLLDPTLGTSDGIIGAFVSFLTYNVSSTPYRERRLAQTDSISIEISIDTILMVLASHT